jgi:enoyl-CoA hydratase/carnithine racemase
MTEPVVLLERRDRVAVITLNRPTRANTLTTEVLEGLHEAQLQIAADRDVRVVLVTGAGRHFCGGADLREASSPNPPPRRPGLTISFDLIPQPTIAVINGAAMGGGCEVALACDFRYMAAEAKIGLPEIQFGALPLGGGTARLPRVVGWPMAKRLIMTGEHLTAARALEIGLVDGVAPGGSLMDAVHEELVQVLIRRAPYAVRTAKVLLDRALEVDLNTALAFERQLIPKMATDAERTAAREEAMADGDTYARIFSKADA